MRCRFSGWVLAVLFVMGCSSSSGEDDETGSVNPADFYRGGSRLKAQVTTTAEGLSWPTESRSKWHDSALNKGCAWEASGPDGAFICMPQDLEWVPRRGRGYYFDAACTEGLYLRGIPLPPSPLVVKKKDFCGGDSSIHVVGARVPNAPTYFHNGTECRAEPLPPGHDAYRVGEEVAAGTYVRGTLKQLSGNGISAYFIEGEDGSMQFSHLQDTVRDTACTPVKASDGKPRCFPVGNTTVRTHASSPTVNDTCTEPAFSDSCVDAPRFAVIPAVEGCGPGSTVYEAGEQVTQLYSSASESTCRPSTGIPTTGRFFRAGAELPASTFLEAKEVGIKSYGRLQVRGLQLDGSVQVPLVLHDTRLDTDCKFAEDTSQRLRCFPDSSILYSETFFADSACTKPLAFERTLLCVSSSRYALQSIVVYDETLKYQHRAYHAGPKYEGPVFMLNTLGGNNPPSGCLPFERQRGIAFYRLGAELSATSLVEGTRIWD